MLAAPSRWRGRRVGMAGVRAAYGRQFLLGLILAVLSGGGVNAPPLPLLFYLRGNMRSRWTMRVQRAAGWYPLWAMAALLTGCGGGIATPAGVDGAVSASHTGGGQALAVSALLAPGSYYVAPDGNDQAAGSLEQPWRSVQRAVQNAGPGVTVLVRGGVYSERVLITASGNQSTGPLVLQAYPQETPVLDGSALAPPADGNPSGLVTLKNVSDVRVVGFELRNYATASASAAPAGLVVIGAGSRVELRSNKIHHIRTTAANGNAFGIAVFGTQAPASISDLVIDGNEVSYLNTGASESVVVNGNVERWQITNNLIHDNDNIGIDAIGYEGTAPMAAYDRARDGVISGNHVHHISSYGNPAYGNEYAADGIYVDGGTRILIERNTVDHNDIGIEVASEHRGKLSDFVTVRSNLIFLNTTTGISLGGYSSRVGGTDRCSFVHNTLYQNDTQRSGLGEVQIQFYSTNNEFRNNIVSANEQGLFTSNYNTSSAQPLIMDNNLYFATTGQGIWHWRKASYRGLAQFRATGNDLASAYLDPLMEADFRLRAGSWAIDHGQVLPPDIAGTTDFGGAARALGAGPDIGAFEQ
ncbi:right-handed parallel beta-helix repeat-containing protein [Massilia endophytica]|uniref:right-handed parallel beta-helix repeat-containing protein n=1 Tax=Massilia endophytica TaxID=2899220 RepID=UPI001E658CB1|nr:right-handed parallel beta-helix repeat-containing protein [Massilia endophytica]UGQ47986.1 right-handed parallel beta-helix repeat-containing protein [Massilia endophytica]